MKLKMSLPDRPGLIHMLPGMDVLALVLILPLIASSFKSNAGIEIVMPSSPYRLAAMERSVQVSIQGGANPKIWVNKREVREYDLLKEIAKEVEAKGKGSVVITLQVDVNVPSGYKAEIVKKLKLVPYRVFDMRTPAMK